MPTVVIPARACEIIKGLMEEKANVHLRSLIIATS